MIDHRADKPLARQTIQNRKEAVGVFERYCAECRLVALPATRETVLEYLEHRSRSTASAGILSIFRAIRDVHIAQGYHHLDNVRPMLEPLLRTTRTGMKFRPLISKDDLLRTVRCIDSQSLIGCRDKAILLSCAGGWFFRNELPLLHTDYLEPLAVKGLLVAVPGRREREVVLPRIDHEIDLCPVRAIRRFLVRMEERLGSPYRGPLFPNLKGVKRFGNPLGLAMFKKIAFQRFTAAGIWELNLGMGALRTSGMVSALSAGIVKHEIEKRGGFRSAHGFRAFESRAQNLYAPVDDADL
jgi:hypothetical protein